MSGHDYYKVRDRMRMQAVATTPPNARKAAKRRRKSLRKAGRADDWIIIGAALFCLAFAGLAVAALLAAIRLLWNAG